MSTTTLQGAGHRRIGALRSICWAFTLGTFASACYRNVPVAQPSQVTPGGMVRIQFSLEGSRQMERQLGPEVRSVFGKLDAVQNDTVYLLLQESRTINGQVLPTTGNPRVAIARVLIAEMNERVHNKRRSVLAAVAVIASAVVLLVVASKAIGGGGQDGTTPPPPPPT